MLRYCLTLSILFPVSMLCAQGPTVTSWVINPGAETGYGGYLTNTQQVWYTNADVYVVCTCIPGYDIGPWAGNPNTPANQNFTFKLTRTPVENTGTDLATGLGHIGVWRNGVSIFNAKDGMSYNNQGVWNRDALVWEGSSFDLCLGHPAPNGEYHHHVNPACLYDYMDDQQHADLIGFAFDGFPIYGAFAYTNTDGTGPITRMRSSYRLRTITDRTTLPNGTVLTAGQYGPAIGGQYPLGAYLEDYEYAAGYGDLDEHNGRFSITPEYPVGTYAYFVTVDDQLDPAYPYVLGPTYYGTVQSGNTGPASGHNTIPGGATLYDPGTVDITAVEQDRAVQLFPIPANDLITTTCERSIVRSVEVLDRTGRCILRSSPLASAFTLDISTLSPGAYVMSALTDDGVVRRPFVKQ